jgi:hypothetical protein
VVVETTCPKGVLAVTPHLAGPVDTVRVVGHGGGQIGGHVPGKLNSETVEVTFSCGE